MKRKMEILRNKRKFKKRKKNVFIENEEENH